MRQDLFAKNETLEKAIAAHISKTKGNAYSTSPPAASTETTTEDTIAPAEAAQRKKSFSKRTGGGFVVNFDLTPREKPPNAAGASSGGWMTGEEDD